MSSSYEKLKQMVSQIVAEQLNTLMFHLSADPVEKQKEKMTLVLEEVLKMIHGTRWHSITFVQLGDLFDMLQEEQNVFLKDFIFNGTNRLMFELGMVSESELSLTPTRLFELLANAITCTRGKTSGKAASALAPVEYRDRGMTGPQWQTVMAADPWVAFIVLLCYLNIDIQSMLPAPQKPSRVKPNA